MSMVQIVSGSQIANCRNDHQIYNRQDHIEQDINLKKTIQEIKAEMNDYAIDQIVILLHKEVHYKTKSRHDYNVGYDIWDHLKSHIIRINKPEYRVPECPYYSLYYRRCKKAVFSVQVRPQISAPS